MIFKLGYYWDDWVIAYYIHFYEPHIFTEVFAGNRPLLGWLYTITTTLVGESPAKWQVLCILVRWICSVTLWFTLLGIWPRRIIEVTSISLLFAVYPGFRQQYIAISYSHHLIVLAITLFSLCALNWGARHPRWLWPLYFISVVSAGTAMFTLEYFFGLEFLRPVFLWIVFKQTIPDIRKRIQRVILYWSPYVILLVSFVIWRFLNKSPRAKITFLENLSIQPFVTLLDLLKIIIQDIIEVTALAWKQTLNFSNIAVYEPLTILKYSLIVFGVATIIIIFLLLQHKQSAIDRNKPPKKQFIWALEAILLGLYALVVAGIPIWMTNLSISLSFPYDRFTLPMMVGASILLVGLIVLLPLRVGKPF